jgi:hypothetical protein
MSTRRQMTVIVAVAVASCLPAVFECARTMAGYPPKYLSLGWLAIPVVVALGPLFLIVAIVLPVWRLAALPGGRRWPMRTKVTLFSVSLLAYFFLMLTLQLVSVAENVSRGGPWWGQVDPRLRVFFVTCLPPLCALGTTALMTWALRLCLWLEDQSGKIHFKLVLVAANTLLFVTAAFFFIACQGTAWGGVIVGWLTSGPGVFYSVLGASSIVVVVYLCLLLEPE